MVTPAARRRRRRTATPLRTSRTTTPSNPSSATSTLEPPPSTSTRLAGVVGGADGVDELGLGGRLDVAAGGAADAQRRQVGERRARARRARRAGRVPGRECAVAGSGVRPVLARVARGPAARAGRLRQRPARRR